MLPVPTCFDSVTASACRARGLAFVFLPVVQVGCKAFRHRAVLRQSCSGRMSGRNPRWMNDIVYGVSVPEMNKYGVPTFVIAQMYPRGVRADGFCVAF